MFEDRRHAGRRLAAELSHLKGQPIVVLGLPRGGVPVAAEVALALHAPLDVIVVRKLGLPFQPEVAMGALGEGGVRVLDDEVIRRAGVTPRELAAVEDRERAELERRTRRLRTQHRRSPIAGRTAVVVDDGVATGSTARAACQVARAQGASRVVLAVPVAPPEWTDRLGDAADEYVCVESPPWLHAVGQGYVDFAQSTDEDVDDALRRTVPPARRDDEVTVAAGTVALGGHLMVPRGARGMVVFAHGSASSRHGPRNRYVASVLVDAGLGTLLFDLLTPAEEHDRANVFDVELLAGRIREVTRWLRAQPDLAELPIGCFGASTGAAAALRAAAEPGSAIAAVVSRGGRPDLAGPRLSAVTAPTLLIVGGDDDAVLRLNREAQAHLRCENELLVVPGATHLFEEPGTLRAAAEAARDWFVAHLAGHAG